MSRAATKNPGTTKTPATTKKLSAVPTSSQKTQANLRSVKPELKICHLADVHLGYRRYNRLNDDGINQREADVSLAFRETIDRIIKIKPDLVIIAGDLFHSLRPSNLVVLFCFRELRRLRAASGAQIVIIAGNHETPRRSDLGSVLRIFSEIDGVHIADTKKELFAFPSTNAARASFAVTCLPHQALSELDNLKLRADDRFDYNVLVAHCQTQLAWISDFGGVDCEWSKLASHEWDYMALGHVHSYRELALNAAYSGSLEYTSNNIWAEAGEKKGFLEVQLPSGKRTFQQLTSPREVLVLEPIEVKDQEPDELSRMLLERLAAVPAGLEGKIVRLELINMPRSHLKMLDHKEIRRMRSKALNLTVEFRYRETERPKLSLKRNKTQSLFEELTEFSSQALASSLSKHQSAAVIKSSAVKEQEQELHVLLESYWHKSDPHTEQDQSETLRSLAELRKDRIHDSSTTTALEIESSLSKQEAV